MKTSDVTVGNVAKIAALWPQCVTERLGKDGKPELAIDFDKLRAELSTEVLDDGEERYQFTWPDKRAASRLANTPSNMTLRPCVEDSVGKDGTTGGFDSENLYIEGDNLEVLKLLREDYLGKVKMIYIDPPYNTGNDFVYNDDFAISTGEFEERGAVRDAEGNLIVDPMQRNTESNGRFHTDWLNMIYPRLKVARDLLTEDGVIFISMDDSEIENLTKICNEIFGEQNFVEVLKWKKKKQPSFLAKHTAKVMEYVLVYAKDWNLLEKLSIEGTSDGTKKVINVSNPECERVFKTGVKVKGIAFGTIPAGAYTVKTMTVEYLDDVVVRNGRTTAPIRVKSKFSVSQDSIDKFCDEDLLFITAQKGLRRDVSQEEMGSRKSITDLLLSEWGDNQESDREFLSLFPHKYFDFCKPTKLIGNLVKCNNNQNEIILDFFSGSATTAHAVMQLNAEDGGKRRYILVQLPEETEADSEARKAGYKNICEIGKERIRRAGRKVKEEAGLQGQDLDIGFRVLKLDSSNMEDVFYTPEDFDANNLFTMVDNVKEGRTAEDLLFQIMPELNIPLSAKIEVREINGKKVFVVDDGYLVATFDKDVNTDTVKAMAQMKPQYFVMRDASAESDNVLDDFEQIFRHYSPDTVRKIL